MGEHPPVVLYTRHAGHVLTLVQVSEQSGVLTFAPTARLEDASWLATCVLRQGSIMSCQAIRRADDEQLTGPEALAWVQQQPAFWHLRPLAVNDCQERVASSPTGAKVLAPSIDRGVTPRHTAFGKSMPVKLLAREQRVVFLLLDGHRRKADLLRLLPALDEDQLDQLLEQFAQRGLIER